jgi:hypothetical protein
MAAIENNSNLYRHGRSPFWWVRCQLDGRELRASLKTSDLAEARRRRDIFLARHHVDGLDVQRTDWKKRCRAAVDNSQSWLRSLWASANKRNRRMGVTRPMSIKAVYAVAIKSHGRCAVTGIRFAWNGDVPVSGAYAISLDRITPGKPYSAKNCRMVIRAVNMAMNVWGEAVFWDVAQKAVGRRLLSDNRQI